MLRVSIADQNPRMRSMLPLAIPSGMVWTKWALMAECAAFAFGYAGGIDLVEFTISAYKMLSDLSLLNKKISQFELFSGASTGSRERESLCPIMDMDDSSTT